MKKLVAALWSGEVPLARAFWEYAILWGTLLNLVTTLGAFMLLEAEGQEGAAVALLLLPVPYNVFMLVAVWRSAARYEGPPHWAQLARAAIALWVALASLA